MMRHRRLRRIRSTSAAARQRQNKTIVSPPPLNASHVRTKSPHFSQNRKINLSRFLELAMGDSTDENCRCRAKKYDETRTVTLDFGRVPVDAKVVKAVKLRNDNCKEETYQVQRDPITNSLDTVFHFDKYSWSLDSNSEIICRVQYHPIIPSQRSVDYFTIVTCGGTVLKIIAQGESIGPNATVSIDRLLMVCALGGSVRKRLKIINDSDVSANFTFDVDERQNCFKPEPSDGRIGPNSHIHIVITFRPTFEGPHVFYLPCLVHHQAPIMIYLYGYCGKKCTCDKIPALICPPSEKDSFSAYMSDSNHFKQRREQQQADPISLSNNYLDFGRTVPGSYNFNLRSPLTTCFTNHSSIDMLVKWHEDVDGIFSFKPSEERVNAGETCIFEVRFDPDEQNTFYTREITALALWVDRDHSLPISSYAMVASIRLLGHTFPAGSSNWIPQYEIPQTVIMPPCLPSSSVHTTFVIRKWGHLPLMFRFVAPKESRFSVKPMLGIIYKNYGVIVVEMFPKNHGNLLCERWSIMFNGNPEYEVFVDFRGYAEYPCLSLSSEVITFLPTHPGCERVERVAVRNPTRHQITYWFDDSTSVLRVDRAQGQINSNEIVMHNWTFCPLEEGDYEFDVICSMTATNERRNNDIFTLKLRVVGKCKNGFLSAAPNELNFGEQACDEVGFFNFNLINPGPVEIPYELSLKHHSWPYEDKCMDRVKLSPTLGILRPEEKENIEICLTPREPGLHELSIQYSVRRNSQINQLLSTNEPLHICRIKYFCVLPVIKVEDLLQYRMEPNMSKFVLWRLLNIKKLNKILSELRHGESGDLEMRFPPMILQDEPSIIKLLISNRTSAVSTWSFKQIKLCSCAKSLENRGLSFHCLKYNCLHRSLCTIYPKSGSLKAREKTTITMELRYSLLGETKIQWNLDVGHDRRISLYMKMTGLSGLEKSAFLLYGSHIELKKIYIGDRDPINQICWIYNPTLNDVAYSVDTTAFKEVNENHHYEIFSCLNPSGTVKALSHEPILIKFQPRGWGSLEVKVPLTLGSERTAITIKGESANEPSIKMSQEISPVRDILRLPEVPVYFNSDHVTLPPTPTHSRVTRLIMVHNRSESEVIAYKWKRREFPEIIELDIEPKTARIQPGTLQTHRLIVLTRGKPCRINADITCEFINQSKKRAYEKSVLVHSSLCEEMKHHFTITEKGTTVPKPDEITLEEPKPFCKTLTVRCYIYSPQDEELKTRPKERLKNTPPLEISMERRSGRFSTTRETMCLSKLVLEGVIWKILQSTNFSALPKNDIKYSQIATSPLRRKRIKQRSYVRPSGRIIERIFENMIFMIVHKEFALDVIHLTQTSDARQVAYQNMWQQVPPHRKGLERSPNL